MVDWAKAAGFAAFLAVALAGSLHWALYYPPPSYFPSEGNEQSNPSEPAQTTNGEPRGTEADPLVVKVLPPVPGTPEATERRRDQDQKSATDRGLVWFTAVLSIATLALMFVTGGLVFLGQRQMEDARIIQRAYVKMS